MNPINDNHHQEQEGATPPPAAAAASRCIYSEQDMQAWRDSPQKQDLLRVVAAMGKSCASSQLEYSPTNPLQGLSPAMASLHGSLTQMQNWLDEIPPLAPTNSNQIRFGNPAFQQWHARLKERSLAIMRSMYLSHQQQLSVEAAAEQGKKAANSDATVDNNDEEDANDFPDYLSELACYLQDAFGHPVRLDYGTGHESSFMIVLYGICKLGWMDPDASGPPSMDKLKAATLAIFHVYLQQTRQLQTKYKLEPAGSHGVWGLDDYHCLPFYFGACQLAAPSNIDVQPNDITVASQRQQYASTYLYFGCMQYICTLKQNAPLWECSPMLYDISQTCATWSKVASGLLKLYDGEVLSKRQVVQHFTFGSHLFVAHWTPSPPPPQPPSHHNFRETTSVSPMVRAPWASSASSSNAAAALPRGPLSSHTTTASGDDNEQQHDHPTMPPPSTKAPWAK